MWETTRLLNGYNTSESSLLTLDSSAADTTLLDLLSKCGRSQEYGNLGMSKNVLLRRVRAGLSLPSGYKATPHFGPSSYEDWFIKH